MTKFLRGLRGITIFLIGLALLPLGTTASLASIQSEQAGRTGLIGLRAQHHALGFHTIGYIASNGSYALRVEFVGSRAVQPRVAGSAAPGASLERVTYAGLWDGIDLTYRATDAGIAESLYEVAPGADPGAIRLRYNAPLTLNADGTLTSTFATGTLTESAPVAWQEIDGKRVDVPVRFALAQAGDGHEIGFAVGDHDPSTALYIDPTLVWNTFLGGPVPNPATEGPITSRYGVALDADGNIYVVGSTLLWSWGSPIRPLTVAQQAGDAFVAKLSPDGALLWNTFLGGAGDDAGYRVVPLGGGGVAVMGTSDAAWGTGEGLSTNPQRAFTPGTSSDGRPAKDTFVAYLLDGTLLGLTFLGGDDDDFGQDMVFDGSGALYVVGTSYAGWVVSGRGTGNFNGRQDAFVTKIEDNALLNTIDWNTFLGSATASEGAWGVDFDDTLGRVLVVGQAGGDFGAPVRPRTARFDAFVAALDPTDGALLANTYLGGNENDLARAVTVAAGQVFVAGESGNNLEPATAWPLPTDPVPVSPPAGGGDAWVARLASDLTLEVYTFIGNSARADLAASVVVRGSHVYVGGQAGAPGGARCDPTAGAGTASWNVSTRRSQRAMEQLPRRYWQRLVLHRTAVLHLPARRARR